jgi:general transcriptional corepressor CYC8
MAAGVAAPSPQHRLQDGPPRDGYDRPPSALKRHREWEPEGAPSKKLASDETRTRLDDHASLQVSPTGRVATPPNTHRRNSSEIRKENQRIADQNYHPSEAAHHPAPLAPPTSQPLQAQHGPASNVPLTPQSQHSQQMPPITALYDAAKEEQKDQVEGAARKVNVDENYDDEGEDDKRAVLAGGLGGSGQGSPRGIAGGTGQPKTEIVSA